MGRQSSLIVGAVGWFAPMVGCGPRAEALPPYAEVLVEVDTDLRAPQTISRVRFDLFDSQRQWIASRDLATPEAGDFPLSFSLYSDVADSTSAWLRVRGYLEGRLRDYDGERFVERPEFEAPVVAGSLEEACREAPLVAVAEPQTLRFGAQAFDGAELTCAASTGAGQKSVQSGLAVFRLEIADAGRYRIAVVGAQPGSDWAFVADTLLSLRTDCAVAATELGCSDDERRELGNAAGVTQELEPGRYFVLVGNAAPGPMDVTLLVEPEASRGLEPQVGGGDFHFDTPRLIVDGADVTPVSEPDPALAVDRLLRLELTPARQGTARILLAGECLGSMADLAGSRSCVDREGVLDAVASEPLLPGRLAPAPSRVGTWSGYQSEPCPGAETPQDDGTHAERSCVRGGSFVLGDPTLIARGADGGRPERIATIPTFAMDRYEYSVGRYRRARQHGFSPPDAGPSNNFAPLALDNEDLTRACTWNEALDGTSLFPEREALPLSCVSWLTARALCELEGGRLPSVAEREFAASAADRERESSFPWGESPPECDQALFGRWRDSSRGSAICFDAAKPAGPRPVDAEPWASFDRTAGGIVGLGGNLAEWTRDSHRPYADPCWRSQPHLAPECDEPEAPLRTIAGGSWRSPAAGTRATTRVGGAVAGSDPWVGFRCVYAVGAR